MRSSYLSTSLTRTQLDAIFQRPFPSTSHAPPMRGAILSPQPNEIGFAILTSWPSTSCSARKGGRNSSSMRRPRFTVMRG